MITEDNTQNIRDIAVTALEDLKAQDIRIVDLRGKSPLMDMMIIATGSSHRHVKSLAGNVIRRAKEAGLHVRSSEGEREGNWALVDLDDVVVHVMLPRIREFYNLEKLWTAEAVAESGANHEYGQG